MSIDEFFLEPPVGVAPAAPTVPAVRPATLGGIDWAGLAAETRGEIALVDVALGEGERQEWIARGEIAR
ncbi:hypothetical protein [Microbacterium trichothecenolyticum]|uniref:Uncharacterized protein n=1 Tax=Microbacterium trichothecenolyticum TaxID=69370 RepID=A0A0M2HM88_MICTR|nr:hypothetical protein [Microbacterium trichothecenolyticum]KJL45563.1 hypothetical protein RS82_00115 [Microbacterium trichothecenolyticum]